MYGVTELVNHNVIHKVTGQEEELRVEGDRPLGGAGPPAGLLQPHGYLSHGKPMLISKRSQYSNEIRSSLVDQEATQNRPDQGVVRNITGDEQPPLILHFKHYT